MESIFPTLETGQAFVIAFEIVYYVWLQEVCPDKMVGQTVLALSITSAPFILSSAVIGLEAWELHFARCLPIRVSYS